jgi:hypothetical protein
MGNIRVIYDYQAFTLQTHGGISRCFAELYKHLPQEVTAQIAVRESDNVYIREMEGVMPTKYNINIIILYVERILRGKDISIYGMIS